MSGTCMNCKAAIDGAPRIFQGVLICDNCFKIVSHFVARTKSELQMVFLAYTDMLRVALVRGELRPPPAAPRGDISDTKDRISLRIVLLQE